MPKFYFTYGTSETQPYKGGWSEVIAPDMRAACEAFRSVHPDRTPNILNCADYYTEEEFLNSCMNGPDGNMGHHCREVIHALTVEIIDVEN